MGWLKKEILDVGSPGYSKVTLEVKGNYQYILIINIFHQFLHSGLFLSTWTIPPLPILIQLPNSIPTLKYMIL